MWKLLLLRMLLLLVVVVVGRREVEGCTLTDLLGVQSNLNVPVETVQGHWYVNKVYGVSTQPYHSYTADFVASGSAFKLKTSSRSSSTANCDFNLYDLQASGNRLTYYTPDGQTGIVISLVIAAADSNGNYTLAYICGGRLKQGSDSCTPIAALAVGRTPEPDNTITWLSSVAASIPCYSNSGTKVNQLEKDDCFKDLKSGIIHQARVATGLMIALLVVVRLLNMV